MMNLTFRIRDRCNSNNISLLLLLLTTWLLLLLPVVVVSAEDNNDDDDGNSSSMRSNRGDGSDNTMMIVTTKTTSMNNDIRVNIPDQLPTDIDRIINLPRSERFPSREERVKLYMSNWYIPPCKDYINGFVRYSKHQDTEWPVYTIYEANDIINGTSYVIDSAVIPDQAFILHRNTILDCSIRQDGYDHSKYETRIKFRSNMFMYCLDVTNLVLPAMDDVMWEQQNIYNNTEIPPIILQFGDLKHSHIYKFINLPHIKKFRLAATPDELKKVTDNGKQCYNTPRDLLKTNEYLQPIIWKFATRRHYGLLEQVAIYDMNWSEKKDMAIFRGQLTGSLSEGYDKHDPDIVNCQRLRRCRLVYNHTNSIYVDALLTSTRKRIPDNLNGIQLTTTSVSISNLLQYKAIIMLEGNDVASGLKWSLLSNSVVLMPIPKHTSYAMEELLVPWVHYIPLNDDITDVEEKMKWIIENDIDAQKISYAATLWMQDLVFHPNSYNDDKYIHEEILRRYMKHFINNIDNENENNNDISTTITITQRQ